MCVVSYRTHSMRVVYPYPYAGILETVGHRVYHVYAGIYPLLPGISLTRTPDTGMKCCTPTPGFVQRAYTSLKKFRVRLRMSHITHDMKGYGCRTERTEIPGTCDT